MALSTLRALHGKGRFLWSLLLASLLESAGFIFLAIRSDNTQHVAFLASFAATTIAPVFILIANMQTFGRLVKTITMPFNSYDGGELWFRASLASTAFAFLECLSLPLLSWAIYDMGTFLSPNPVGGPEGAMARLGHYDRSLTLLVAAHVFQVLLCLAFGVVALTFLSRATGRAGRQFLERDDPSHKLLLSINAVNGLVLVSSSLALT